MTDLGRTLERAALASRRAARRQLLRTPLLGQREDPDAYADVLRHRHHLERWFAEHTGWHLAFDESGGFARLHKVPAHEDPTRPPRRSHDRPPFERRRYTLFCLALAALDDGSAQTTLRTLAETLTTRSHELEGVRPYDASRQADRRGLVDALGLLARLGVLCERDGNATRYALGGTGDALYDVDDRRIAQLISAPSSPSLVDSPEDLPVEAYPETEEGERLRARHHVTRRLLEDPVVYYDELDERERDWLQHSLHFIHRLLEDDIGLVVERRAEGLAAVDPSGELSDERFPDGGSTVRHAALLLCEHLTDLVRTQRRDSVHQEVADEGRPPALLVPTEDIVAHVRALVADVGMRRRWARTYTTEESGARTLAFEALALLERFSLVRAAGEGYEPRAAIARFAAVPAEEQPPTLFTPRATGQPGANPAEARP